MQKLNTIFLFVLLSFCLLVNVSFAIEFSAEGIPSQSVTVVVNNDRTTLPNLVIAGNYTIAQGFELWERVTGKDDSLAAYNAFLQACTDKGYTVFGGVTGSSKKLIIIDTNADMGFEPYGVKFAFDEGYNYYFVERNSYYQDVQVTHHISTSCGYRDSSSVSFYTPVKSLSTNKHVKNLTISNNLAFWDGTYKYDEPPIYLPNGAGSSEPDTPTMPTNAEIAQAVQLFNDNVFDEEKTGKICGFSDFFVLYDKSTKKYTYIGHGMGNSLGQLIVAPDYHYEGYKFNKQWWKFFKDTESNDYNIIRDFTKYFVYTSEGTLETLTYIGASNISGLIDKSGPWATDNTIIVYSTIDYPVKNVTFDSSTSEPIVETGTIEGDQYTYDENLDITDNNYNPLDNFITVDPIDTVIGNVNFSEINKTFEENKGILNIENASWLFTANNKLIGYFTGFLSLLIVFLIISRALGG